MCPCFQKTCSTSRVNPRLLRHFSWSKQHAYSQSFEAHTTSLRKKVDFDNGPASVRPKSKPKSFGALGLHPPIVSALRTAFPNIKDPTENQAVLIPALLAGHDVFLEDQTGSGKSFGLVLALLNKPRTEKRKRAITSIFIVPHRELAYQFHGWIERMFAPAASIPAASTSSISQVLVRDSQGPGLSLLRENPPHILFCTPQALMDVWRAQPDVLQLRTLSAIVVDEADSLIPTVEHRTSRKRKVLKQQQHPGDTREFLDLVYGNNAQPFPDEDAPPEQDGPQLILSSATLPAHLVDYVSEESGWLNRDNWVSVSGASSESRSRQPKSQVTHSVLVVSEDNVRNIADALPSDSSEDFEIPVDTEEGGDDPIPEVDPALLKKYMQTVSPFNPLALETIAMIFAADVPSTALLVIPSTSPIHAPSSSFGRSASTPMTWTC
ncbi:P-loop containing nucleoside triphosphate hydrolase protein [Mycena rosella]|uniref:RNA helicase n=1 Tax=Mycena rosella TaxID=1033263 RepID=A0AAD7M984_MYCRO|nr:P-loop containing nucleoside triphosphate hydrolase protein [Mycena rosella]